MIALGLLAVFFIGSLLLIKQPTVQKTSSLVTPAEKVAPSPIASQNVAFVLNQFHRAEMKDGKKLWEVEALKGVLDPQTNIATLEQASVFVYRDQETTVHVTAPTAQMTIKGASLTKLDASGGVKLFYNNEYVVETGQVILDRDDSIGDPQTPNQGLVSAPGDIKITGSQFSISGVGFSGDLTKRQFTINKSVKSAFFPKPTNKQS